MWLAVAMGCIFVWYSAKLASSAIGSVLAPPSPTVPFEKVTSSGAQSHFFAATSASWSRTSRAALTTAPPDT